MGGGHLLGPLDRLRGSELNLVKLDELLHWLKDTGFATAISRRWLAISLIESVHVLAVTIVIGSIGLLELRLIGLTSLNRSVSRVLKDVLPITWSAFAASVISGFLLFASNAPTYAANAFFLSKLVLLAAAGLIRVRLSRLRGALDRKLGLCAQTPLPARLSGIFSLVMWVGIVVCGRWVGFTLVPTPERR